MQKGLRSIQASDARLSGLWRESHGGKKAACREEAAGDEMADMRGSAEKSERRREESTESEAAGVDARRQRERGTGEHSNAWP